MLRKNDNYDFTTMLEEAQKYYDAQIRSFDVLRDHGKTVLGTASVLVSLFAIFGTTNLSNQNSIFYALIIASIAVLYGWLMFKSLLASIPKNIHYPIDATEQEYAKAYLNKNKKDIIKQRIANYLNIIEKNEKFLAERRAWAILITAQLAIIVILILVASLLPLIW